MGRIKRNPQKSCINRVSCPRGWRWFGANCEKSGAKLEGGRLGTRDDDPREKPRRALFLPREETSAPCEFFLSKSTRSVPLGNPSKTGEFTPLVYGANPRKKSIPRWEKRHGRGGGEGHPETLGVAVNGTVSNGIFRIGRSGWRADIFRSRTPSERRGRRGLCARPPIKKIKSPRYFL